IMKNQLLILAILAVTICAKPLNDEKEPPNTIDKATGGGTLEPRRRIEKPSGGPGPGGHDGMADHHATLRDILGSFNNDKIPYGPIRGPNEAANRNLRDLSGSEVFTANPQWLDVFTTLKGTGQTVYDAWRSNGQVSHNKCPVVDQWESLNIQRVKVVLESSEGNVELIFNGTNTDKFNWFSKSRLLSSPWNDINTEPQNVFSIVGEPRTKRSFYINRNHDGCLQDAGWLAVADGGPLGYCEWERAPEDQLPYILFSKTTGYANYNGGDIATADRMVIYIDTPGKDVLCSCPAGQFLSEDGTRCVLSSGTDVNVALGKTVYQTSTMEPASRAVDGNTNSNWLAGSCTHTADAGETGPSWWVDLAQSYMIARVVIFNRQDGSQDRLNPFNIHIGDSDQVSMNPKCGGDHRIALDQPTISVSCPGMMGRYVGVRLPGPSRVLTLCEVQVYTETDSPQFLTCSTATYTSLTISWVKPRAPLIGYRVTYTLVSDSPSDVISTDFGPENEKQVLRDVLADREYSVTLVAVGMYEESLSVEVNCATLTPPPEDFKLKDSTETSITVSWKQKSNSLAIGYRMWIGRSDTDESLFTQLVPTGQTDLTFSDLSPATEYVISAASTNRYSEGPAVDITVGTKTDSPTALYIEQKTTSTVTISWLPPEAMITAYNITYTGNGRSTSVMEQGDVDSCKLTGLVPGSQYDIDLVAVSRFGNSLAVSTSVITDTDPPSRLNITKSSKTWLFLEWTSPVANILSYDLEISDEIRSTRTFFRLEGHTTSYNVTDLVPETTYVFKMGAFSEFGRSISPIEVSTDSTTEVSTSDRMTTTSTTSPLSIESTTAHDSDVHSWNFERTTSKLTQSPSPTAVNKDAITTAKWTTTNYMTSPGRSTEPPRISQTSTPDINKYTTSPKRTTEEPAEKGVPNFGLDQSLPETLGAEDILAAAASINDIIKPADAAESEMPPSVLQTTAGIIEKLATAARGSQSISIENMETIADALVQTASAAIDVLPKQKTQIDALESDLIDTSATDLSPRQQLKVLKEKQKEKEDMQREASQIIVASLDQVADTLLALQPQDMSVFKKNPYSWSKSTGGQNISSSVAFLTIDSKNSGTFTKNKKVKLDMPFVPSHEKQEPASRSSHVTTESPSTAKENTNGTTMVYHAFNVPADNVIPVIRMNWWDVEATFHVYISYGSPPTAEKFVEKRVIKEDGYEAWLKGTNFSASFIPNTTDHDRVLYIGVQKLGHTSSTQGHQQQPTVQILSREDYALSMSAVGCSSWNDNKKQWRPEGCDADIALKDGVISCRCPVTEWKVSVGTMTLPLPNSINFINAFKNFLHLSDNSVVFSIVVSEVILYLHIMVLLSYFTCNDWLSREKGDGEVQKVVHASTEEDLTSFTNVFKEASRDVFYDKQLWASALVAAPVVSRHEANPGFTECVPDVACSIGRFNLHKAQRLSCCFTLLNTMMLSSAMWYKAENTTADTRVLNLGFVRFTIQELYISLMTVLTVLPVNLVLLQLFRMEAPLSVNTPEMSIRPSKKGYLKKTFHLAKYMAWVTVFLVSTSSAFFVLLYSMDWEKEKSDAWMKAFVLSFMGSSCVMDTLQIFVLAVGLAAIFSLPFLTKPPVILKEDLQLNLWNSKAPKKVYPPAKPDVKSARKKKELNKKSASVLKEFLLLFIFVVLLFYIAQADKDQHAFYETQSLSNNILQEYDAIKTPDQFYAWTEDVLLPTLYPATWYNGRDMKYLDRQFAHNTGSFRLGPPRLTQVRKLPGSTSVASIGWSLSGNCWRFNVTDVFSYSNGTPECTNHHSFDVPLNHDSAVSFFGVLKDNQFFDKYTKSVTIAINFYNPSLKLFSVVNMIINRSGVGHLVPTATITSFRLFQYENDADYVDLFMHILFTLLFFVIFCNELKAIVKNRWKYFTSKWNALGCVSLIGTATTISVFIKRYVVASETLAVVAKSNGDLGFERFVDLQTAAWWDACFKHILGLVVFINTISLLRVVRFSQTIGKLLALPGIMKEELLSFLVVAAIAFIAFISSAHLIFGSHMESYADLYHTTFALFEMMLGRFFAQDMLDSNPLTGPIFFSSFMICIFILLMNFLMTIVCDAISADVDVSHDQELGEYIWRGFRAMLGFHSTPDKENKPGELNWKGLEANIVIIQEKLDEGLDICNSILPSRKQMTSDKITREDEKLSIIDDESHQSTTGIQNDNHGIQKPTGTNVDTFDIDTEIQILEQEFEEEKNRKKITEHHLLTEIRVQTKQIEDILVRVNRATTKPTVQKVPRCIQVAAGDTQNGKQQPAGNTWISDLKLTAEDKAVLLSDEVLTDKHIHAAQMLLRRQYPGLGGLQDTTVGASPFGYTRVSGEGLQIHHTGQFHWVLSSSIGGHVRVYNSIPGRINALLESQLTQCYAPVSNMATDVLTVKVPRVQLQESGSTCGLFAIAWAVDIAMGTDVTQVRYNESKMRAHLLDCFERGHLSPFPRVRQVTRRRASAVHRISLVCRCGQSRPPTKERRELAAVKLLKNMLNPEHPLHDLVLDVRPAGTLMSLRNSGEIRVKMLTEVIASFVQSRQAWSAASVRVKLDLVILSFMTPVQSVLPGNPRVIDMTHTFDENTIYWPTLRHFKRTGVLRNYTAGGTWREESDIEGAEHGGKHLDAPAHFSKNKWRSHDIPVERLMGPAVVVDVSPKAAADADYLVTAEDFQLWEEKHGKIPDGCLLFDSRNTSLLHFPGLHPDGARWLVQNRGMHAVGIDTASIDYGQSKKYEAHQILLAHNVLAFENVANMDKLPTTGATVYALPIKIGDGSGGPVRIVGIIENTKNPVKTPRPGQGQQVIDMTYTLDDTTLYRPGRKPFRLADVFRN
ncbi:hypothetical protein Bbelb_418640, partial [Branchiostoma belcheri]